MQADSIKIMLVGSPNVGKSVIFNYLTGRYAAVSNYPGTTVAVSRGRMLINNRWCEIIDTPGLYSLSPITDEERITRNLLCEEKPDLVIQVIDAKNLSRLLAMTLQLMDAGWPLIVNLNIMDEAERLGLQIDTDKLAEILAVPVIATAAIRKIGLGALRTAIASYQFQDPAIVKYTSDIEQAVDRISGELCGEYGFSRRFAALLMMQGDEAVERQLHREPTRQQIDKVMREVAGSGEDTLAYRLAIERGVAIDRIIKKTVRQRRVSSNKWRECLDRWTREPLTGIPILCLVVYFGLYQFVGIFGAGVLVDYFEREIFFPLITPCVMKMTAYLPTEGLRALIIGEYGLFTLGLRYALVIIMPITATFFLAFSFLEDSGYLPRLAMMTDHIFKYFGLNGRAVIPMALGFGCGTMAVIVTRTLETRRERILATFLLSLAVPCSAQLGVVLSLLAHNQLILVIWAIYVLLVFILIGWLSAALLPGKCSPFYMELPPLRLPQPINILRKAWSRMLAYLLEIVPIFLLTSFVLWFSDQSGALQWAVQGAEPVMSLLGMPTVAASAFFLGFFRRDYGAAGLYDLRAAGLLSDRQLLTAAVTMTLFVPCVAQLAVMIRERGAWMTGGMVIAIVTMALLSGILIYRMTEMMGFA